MRNVWIALIIVAVAIVATTSAVVVHVALLLNVAGAVAVILPTVAATYVARTECVVMIPAAKKAKYAVTVPVAILPTVVTIPAAVKANFVVKT